MLSTPVLSVLVIRLSRLLKPGIPSTAVCTAVSAWLNGIKLFLSRRRSRDDGRALGSSSQMDFALARAGWGRGRAVPCLRALQVLLALWLGGL